MNHVPLEIGPILHTKGIISAVFYICTGIKCFETLMGKYLLLGTLLFNLEYGV
jgi:hypothetical protein